LKIRSSSFRFLTDLDKGNRQIKLELNMKVVYNCGDWVYNCGDWVAQSRVKELKVQDSHLNKEKNII